MSRPYKRQRISDPPEVALNHSREQNDLRLKSTFESIFEKYGKDFDGIGDEIDLETGEIIVNNGHILGMVNERDAGGLESDSEEAEGDDDWSDGERGLTSSLLSEMRRRINIIGNDMIVEEGNFIDGEPGSEHDTDSLLGSHDSLMGDDDAQPTTPALRARSLSPDSLYEDEMEDELAGGEMEWPTPGRAWPTPSKATPLGHTHWHSSPLKQVYKSDTTIDPAWRAPPLPTDGEPPQYNMPVGLKSSDKTHDLIKDYSVQHSHPRISEARTPLQHKVSLASSIGDSRSLNHRRASDGPKSMTLLRNTESIWSPRWTTAEETLLHQLRTTTTLMHGESKPYFPGHQTRAIMIHWSETTGNDGDLDKTQPSRDLTKPVRSPQRRSSSAKNRLYKLPAPATLMKDLSNGSSPARGPKMVDNLKYRASDGHEFITGRATTHPRIKRESPSSLEIANSSDVTEQSQGFLSSSPAPFARPWTTSTLAEYRKPPKNDIKEEEDEAQPSLNVLPSPDTKNVESEPRNSVRTVPQRRAQSFLMEGSGSRSSKSTSKTDYTSRASSDITLSMGRASDPQELHSNSSRKTILRSSYQSDGSDDELSAPVKTVGSLIKPASRRSNFDHV